MAAPATRLPELGVAALETLLDRSGALIYALDAAGTVLTLNAALRERLDADLEQLADWPGMARTLYPDLRLREQVIDAHTRALAGEVLPEQEWTLTTLSGETCPVRWSLQRFGDRLVCIGQDLGERRRLEHWTRLQTSMLDRLGDAIILADLDGRILHWAGAAEQILGYSQRNAIERPLSNIFGDDDPQASMAQWITALKARPHARGTHDLRHADGRVFSCQLTGSRLQDDRGEITAIMLVARRDDDTTAPVAGPSQDVAGALAQLGSVAVIVCNPDGSVRAWSGGAERLAGVGTSRAVGRRALDEVMTVPALGWAGLAARVRSRGRFQGRVSIQRPNGTTSLAELEAVALRGSDEGILIVAVDQQELDAMMREGHAMKERAFGGVLADAFVRRFSDTWSVIEPDHRTVFARLADHRALARMVRAGADLDTIHTFIRHSAVGVDEQAVDDAVLRIGEGLHAMRAIVHDALAANSTEAETPVATRIGAEMSAARALVGHALAGRLTVEIDLENLPTIRASRSPLLRALCLTLLSAAASAGENAVLKVKGRRAPGRVEIELKEDGAGQSPEVLARLGDPAWLGGQRGVGPLYLGLAREAFKAAGGTPEVGSAPGLGSWVRVGFPVAETAMLVRPADPAPARIGLLGQVWVVEDDVLLRRALARTLSQRHNVIEHNDLASVLSAPEQRAPNVAIVSLVEPESLGMRLIDRLLEVWPKLDRGLVVTVGPSIRHEIRQKLVARGVVVVPRPVDIALVQTVVFRMVS